MKIGWMAWVSLCALIVGSSACKQKDRDTGGEVPAADPPPPTEAAAAAEPSEQAGAAAAEAPAVAPLDALPKEEGEHQGAHQWSVSLGGTTKDLGRALAVAKSGETAIGGYFSTTAKLGAETFTASPTSDPKVPDEVDAFIATFDAKGKPLWSRQLGGKGEQIVADAAYDGEGNLVVVGWFGYELTLGDGQLDAIGADDIFVAKFGKDGRRLWAKRYGGPNLDAADAVAIDAAGNIYVTGEIHGETDFEGTALKSAGLADLFVLKLNPAGEKVWVKPFGERYDDYGRALAIDSQGNLIVFGEYSGDTSFGGPTLSSKGNRDLFIAKLDPQGSHLWSKGFGTVLDEIGLDAAVDATGAVIITGSFEDKIDFGGGPMTASGRGDVFVAKYDRDGAHAWSKRFGGKDEDIGSGVAVDSFGNIYVTGWFRVTIEFGGPQLTSKGKRDAFLVKLGPDGSHRWSRSFGDKENDTGRDVAVLADDSLATSGTFRYKVNVGGSALDYAHEDGGLIPYADVYLARYGR